MGGGSAGLETLAKEAPAATATAHGAPGLARQGRKGRADHHQAAGAGGPTYPSAPFGADKSDPGYGGLVRTGRRLALGSARSASGEGMPFLAQTGKARPSEATSPANAVLRRRGTQQGAKKDLPDGLPKCYAHGATRLLWSVADCSNQAREPGRRKPTSLDPPALDARRPALAWRT